MLVRLPPTEYSRSCSNRRIWFRSDGCHFRFLFLDDWQVEGEYTPNRQFTNHGKCSSHSFGNALGERQSQTCPVNLGSHDRRPAIKWLENVRHLQAVNAHTAILNGDPDFLAASLFGIVRSEERRVGKECRSRWSPYH